MSYRLSVEFGGILTVFNDSLDLDKLLWLPINKDSITVEGQSGVSQQPSTV